MGIYKRSMLYLTRKKGKSLLLFLIFFFVSLLLLICFSILAGTEKAAKNLRSNIGAAFYVRPFAEMEFIDGEAKAADTPVIQASDIENVLAAAGGEVKAYNTEHYGYAKSEQLHFIPGSGDSQKSNMGRVTAVRSSELTDKFLTGEYVLLTGRHIRPEDKNIILISRWLAEENGLKIGDKITLTHAGLEKQGDIYTDSIPEKTAFVDVEIAGIYAIENSIDSPACPTAGKAENHIISDCHLLFALQQQREGIYEGEISFFIADPLRLSDILPKVEAVSSIDWNSHILRKNDFQYGQIAGHLQNLQSLALSLIVIVSVFGTAILMLILTLRIRDRVQEAGILLAIGKSKVEIIGQHILEAAMLLLLGFLSAFLISVPASNLLNRALFGVLTKNTATGILQTGGAACNYLKPDLLCSLILQTLELAAVLFTIIASGNAILSQKPNEILSQKR